MRLEVYALLGTIVAFAAITVATATAPPRKEPPRRECCEQSYWRGVRAGREQVYKEIAERREARARGDELPEFMDRPPGLENMPLVN